MKKSIAALALAIMLVLSAITPYASAADYATAERTIRAMGIMNGDQNGNMNLTNPVTRAEFSKMMISASPYKDNVGEGSTVSPFVDVKYTHWAAEYIRTAVAAGWIVGYVDGTFRPSGNVKYEEAATMLLRMLGYSNEDLPGAYPQAQLGKFAALYMNEGLNLKQGDTVTRKDCVLMFYNLMRTATKTGTVYGNALGYTVGANGEIDYSVLLSSTMKGPYVVTSLNFGGNLPFAPESATIYRNGDAASIDDIKMYDVYYYQREMSTVWVYNKQVSGVYTAAVPNAAAPSQVVVGGLSYTLGTPDVVHKMSNAGEFSVGDTVTLLLGKNGEVADVFEGELGNQLYYGIIMDISFITYDSPTGDKKMEMASIFCTDGLVRQYPYSENKLSAGDRVTVKIEGGDVKILLQTNRSVSGRVNSNATAIGDKSIAADVEIMEVTSGGMYGLLDKKRLQNADLEKEDVAFYAVNDKNQISHLILKDATGDFDTYSIIYDSATIENPADGQIIGIYSYMISGQSGTILASTSTAVKEGPNKIVMGGTTLESAQSLSSINITEIVDNKAHVKNGTKYDLADNVQIYQLKNGVYTEISLDSATAKDRYTLKGYYDTGNTLGGRVRIIIAS